MTAWSSTQAAYMMSETHDFYARHPEMLLPHQHRQVVNALVEEMGQAAYLDWLNSDVNNWRHVEEKLLECHGLQFRFGAW